MTALSELGLRRGDSPSIRLAKKTLLRVTFGSAAFLFTFGVAFHATGATFVGRAMLMTAAYHLLGCVLFVATGNFRRLAIGTEVGAGVSVPIFAITLAGMPGGLTVLGVGYMAVIGAALTGRRTYAIVAVGAYTLSLAIVLAVLHIWPPVPMSIPAWLSSAWTGIILLTTLIIIVLQILPIASGRRELALAVKREHERSESLLLNVLPASIATRLKESPGVIADKFDDVTVLFADIVGFTVLAARLPPAQIVQMLDEIFSQFDTIATELELEKIKTIGDAYMVVGGAPQPLPDHADRIARMALRMRDVVKHNPDLKLRIGIQSGPVVAGVIGKKKFIYDLWGDTVNTASRMESHGVPGEIQVAEEAHARLRDHFELESRGAISVKGKGELAAWLLRGPRAT